MVSVAYKVGVNPNIYPKLPENGFIEKTEEGRDLLLTKSMFSVPKTHYICLYSQPPPPSIFRSFPSSFRIAVFNC